MVGQLDKPDGGSPVRYADSDVAVVRIEDVLAMARAVQKKVHRVVDLRDGRFCDVCIRVVRAKVDGEDVFGGVLFPSGERVAHVGFHAVGAPMAASAGGAHIFGVGLSGGVVVEGYGVYAFGGSGVVDEFEGVFAEGVAIGLG